MITTEYRDRCTEVVGYTLLILFWRELKHLLSWWGSGTGLRGRTSDRFSYTVVDSAGSTELHAVQVPLTSHSKQIDQNVLRCLDCTSPASLSHPSYEARKYTPRHAACKQCRKYRPSVTVYKGSCTFSRSSLPCFGRKLENSRGLNSTRMRDSRLHQSQRSFFSIGKRCAKTRPWHIFLSTKSVQWKGKTPIG